MKNKPIDWTKPVENLHGTPLRVLCTDRPHDCRPVVAMDPDGFVECFELDDTRVHNVRQKLTLTGWVNVYPSELSSILHDSQKDAQRARGKDCLACVPVTVEYYEGQGLEDDQDV